MVYTKKDAQAAISRARSTKGQHSTMLAEAQLEALAAISEELGDLNKALGKYGAVGELARQLDSLGGTLRRLAKG
jgi:hypothetical protein